MGFFDSVGSFLGGVGGIASVAAPLIGALKNKPRPAPATAQLDARSTQANRMASAAADPNDPMYRNLVRLEEESGRVDIARAVNEMLRQRQHLARKFGPVRYRGWFNPEREDEALSTTISQQGVEVGNKARKTARDTLINSANAQSGTLSATGNLAQLQGQQGAAQRMATGQLYNTIGAAGKTIADPKWRKTMLDNDWIKALNNTMTNSSIYGPPGGYSYFGGPR